MMIAGLATTVGEHTKRPMLDASITIMAAVIIFFM
jgi:hypothetical protein